MPTTTLTSSAEISLDANILKLHALFNSAITIVLVYTEYSVFLVSTMIMK